jgi:hypothetical protein
VTYDDESHREAGASPPARVPSKYGPLAFIAASVAMMLLVPALVIDFNLKSLVVAASKPAGVKLQIWITLVGAQAAIWVVIAAWLVSVIRRLSSGADISDIVIRCGAPVALLSGIWLYLLLANRPPGFPPAQLAGVPIASMVTPIGSGVAALALFATFLAYRRGVMATLEPTASERLATLAESTSLVHQCLFAGAVILALGIVGSAALCGAANQEVSGSCGPDRVTLFGLSGSLFLLVGYAPIRLHLYQLSLVVIDDSIGPQPSDVAALKTWSEQRATLVAMLGQDARSMFGLGGIVTSLLPLAAGAISPFL